MTDKGELPSNPEPLETFLSVKIVNGEFI